MADKIQLPNGAFFPVKEGESKEQALAVAKQMYPDAFAAPVAAQPKQDTSGFKAAASAGATRLGGEFELLKGKLGLKDEAEAQKEFEAAQKRAQERFTPTEKGFTEDPLLKFRELLGGSLPSMVAPAAAGLAALAAPVSIPVAAGLGLLGAGAVSAGQFTGSNLAAQLGTGKTLEEASLGKAAAAAVPQALIDTAAMALIPGIGKLFGSVGSKLTTEQAKAIANQTLGKTILDYTAKTGVTAGREGVTEATQQLLERLQAGLSITDENARKEYVDSFIGGAVLGGTLAPVGRAFERGGAKRQAAAFDRAEALQLSSAQQQQQQAQEEAAAQALEIERQKPEYAIKLGTDYEALLKDYQDKRKVLKDPGKNATPEEKAVYKEAQAEVKTLYDQLTELTPEYRRTKPIREQEEQQFKLTSPTAETARQVETEPLVSPTQLLERKRQAQQLLEQNQQELSDLVASGDMAQFDKSLGLRKELQKEVAQIDTQLKQVGAVDEQIDPVAVQAQIEKEFAKFSAMAGPGFDPDKAERQRAKIDKLQTQLQIVNSSQQTLDLGAPRTLELPLDAAQKQRQAQGRAATDVAQQRLDVVEQEEQAALEASRVADAQAAEKAALLERMAPEMQALQRIKRAPSPMTENLGLFQNEEAPPSVSPAFSQLQQRLQGIPLEKGTLPTAEEIVPLEEIKRVVTRGEGKEFNLRPISEVTKAPITAENLQGRVNRALSVFDLSPEAETFLRRAEQVIPQADMTLKQEASARANQENIAGEVVASKGVQKNVSESQGFLTLLDKQLAKIESGEEGIPRKGAGRPQMLKTFPPTKQTQAQVSATTPIEAFKKDVDSITGAIPGQAQSVPQMEMYAQRERLERTGKPGKLPGFVAQPEEDQRTQGVPGRAVVEKRAQNINPPVYRLNPVTGKQELVSGTIRGKGVEAVPLSLQRELEPLVRLSETVRDEQAGQLPLFGAADERSRVQKAERRGVEAGPSLDIGARPDVESFQRFMNSPYVRRLQQDMKQSEKDLVPVRAFLSRALPRLKQMLQDSKATTARMSKIKNWTKFLKENQELTTFQTNTENMLLQMNNLKLDVSDLNARIGMYEQAKENLIKESNRVGIRARGGAPEIKLFKELDDLLALHQEAKVELVQTKGALDLVRTQIKVLVGEQRLAELKATTDPLAKANASAQNEIERLQETIRAAQAEIGEAETKERQAAADKTQAVKGAKVANVQQLEKQISDERARRWNTALSGFPQGVQVRALGPAERDARERGLTTDAASEVKYSNDLYNKPLLSLVLELGSIDKQLTEATAKVTAARKKSGSYVGGEQNVMAFKGLGSAIRLQSRLSVRKESLENAINFMRARNVPLKKTLGAEPEVRSAGIEEQNTLDQYIEQVQELGNATDRLADLTVQRDDAIRDGNTKTVSRLNEQIDKVNTEISVGTEGKARLAVALQGRVSAGARQATSAPAKFRTGSEESKRNTGSVKQPLVEQRTIKSPTVKQAVADANAYAEKISAGQKELTTAQEAAIEAERQAEFQYILERREEELTTKLDESTKELERLRAIDARPYRENLVRPTEQEKTDLVNEIESFGKELAAVKRELTEQMRKIYRTDTNVVVEEAETPEPKPRGRPRKVSEEEAYGEDTRKSAAVEDVYFGEDESKIEFSRGAAKNGLSVDGLQKEIDTALGGAGLTKGRIEIFDTVEKFLNSNSFADLQYEYSIKRATPPKTGDIPTDAKAFVDPRTGKAFMFANNIGKGDGLGILLHEVGVHLGFKNLFNAGQYKNLIKAVQNWSKLNDNSIEARVAKAALARVKSAQTSKEQFNDELLAYAVEEAIKAGVKPTALDAKGYPIANWLRMVVDTLKRALSAFGINTKNLKAGELVNLAYGAAQLEIRGTWHGSDAKFKAFDTGYAGSGEGAFDLRFLAEESLGDGPYTTPQKEYANYYQEAVPFGKAATATGYGNKTYQDYRSLDNKFINTRHDELTTAMLQSKLESGLLSAYVNSALNDGESLDPTENKGAARYVETKKRFVESEIEVAQTALDRAVISEAKKPSSETRIPNLEQQVAKREKELEILNGLDLSKIKGLKERPTIGNLYRTLDDVPRERVYAINSDFTVGERPKLDVLLKKYGDERLQNKAKKDGEYAANGLFYDMRRQFGIKRLTEILKAAGIDAIEQSNERGKYTERAAIDNMPEIIGMNLEPIGQSEGLLFSRKAASPDDALTSLSKIIIAQPKTLKEKLSNNLALQAEMQAVDMRAGLRDTLKFGDDKLFTQAMYHVRKAEQKMAQMFTVMNSGPLVSYKDDKGFFGYRSSNENSARDVFDAIADIPMDDPQLKTNIAQTYLVAVRTNNKGLPKLDLGALDLKQSDLDAALAAAEANPALKNALENVRRKYSAYNKGMIEFLASTGRITKKVAADLLKDGDYVPFYRIDKNGNASLVFNNNVTFNVGDIRRQPYLAELKGGDTKLLPLNEALQRNTLLLTDMALTNNAAKSVAYGMQALGKGRGPVDPKTGKPTDLMAIKKGFGPDNAATVRFHQEPDASDPKDDGKRHIVVDTEGTAAEGIPAALVVQSLEGASLALPGFFKLGGAAADLLRAGVTRTPLYIARKLIREPMAAAFTGGLNNNAFSAVFKAGAEYLRMSTGSSDMQAKLIEKGLIQSNIFAGDMSDMKKMALQLASGKDQGALDKVLAAADRYAMRADAATLALILKNAEENGLSEVEADMMTMESMNFYKRGLSPTLQYASRLIPFFNAQIQGLNVLVKAARGNMPFEEQQQIKRKFFNNAVLLMGTGIVYAMAMEDDETFRNARPRDKYSNFFLPIPGVDEPLKLPIPFEAGYFFSLAVAAVDGMRAETDGKAQYEALRDMFLGSIPGYSSNGVPQIFKPVAEVWADKNFLTGAPVEPRRMQGYDVEERYLSTTTDLAKQMSKLLPILSPIQIEHIVRGYLGVLPLVAAAGANSLFEREGKGEKPAGRASDLPLIGTAFQKKYGGGDADVVYREAQEAASARSTLNKMLNEGRREEAIDYRDKNKVNLAMAPAAGQYRQIVGRINTDIRRTQERDDLTAEEKRLRLDALDKAKQDRADAFIRQSRLVEQRLGDGGKT